MLSAHVFWLCKGAVLVVQAHIEASTRLLYLSLHVAYSLHNTSVSLSLSCWLAMAAARICLLRGACRLHDMISLLSRLRQRASAFCVEHVAFTTVIYNLEPTTTQSTSPRHTGRYRVASPRMLLSIHEYGCHYTIRTVGALAASLSLSLCGWHAAACLSHTVVIHYGLRGLRIINV